MSTLVPSTAGAAIGGMFGPLGSMVGQIAGAALGGVIDNAVFGNRTAAKERPRLGSLDVMPSSEGAPVPRIYGRARLAGQVIWATQLEEVVGIEEPAGGGKGMGGAVESTATCSYYANFAVGLCEGVIGRVARVWAGGKPLDLDGLNFRVYRGSEDQAPDALIVAKEGAGNAPAYRGLAYVVFERLPLADFGNRIPQLSFEVIRPIGLLETMTRAVTLIPGTTEFGYEPSPVVQVLGPGQAAPQNRHIASARSDLVAALDDHGDQKIKGLVAGIGATAPAVFARYGITTQLLVAHVMAQISHECVAGREVVENMNYTAGRMMQVWPSRFPTMASAQHYAGNPRALANKVYNSRMGNRAGSDDGWIFAAAVARRRPGARAISVSRRRPESM